MNRTKKTKTYTLCRPASGRVSDLEMSNKSNTRSSHPVDLFGRLSQSNTSERRKCVVMFKY